MFHRGMLPFLKTIPDICLMTTMARPYCLCLAGSDGGIRPRIITAARQLRGQATDESDSARQRLKDEAGPGKITGRCSAARCGDF